MPTGNIQKMTAQLDSPVEYSLPLGSESIALNPYLGQTITLRHTGGINCIACNRQIKKTFNQGFCFPCSQSLAQCDICIVRPERCHFDKGTCREPDWAQSHCFQPHFVYLSVTSGIKVGITRGTQIPTRFIDQGATQALPILKVKTRLIAGLIEVTLAKQISDKTNWRKMLQGSSDLSVDEIKTVRKTLLDSASQQIEKIRNDDSDDAIEVLTEQEIITINYPVQNYLTKISSFNFDKTPEISGVLQGIKGQYLIFDSGVLNIRKFAGYEIELKH